MSLKNVKSIEELRGMLKKTAGKPLAQMFGNNGISMSEAQRILEKAKGMQREVEKSLAASGPYRKTLFFESRDIVMVDPLHLTFGDISTEIWGLVAYLYTAIKSKKQLLEEAEKRDIMKFMVAGEVYPEEPVRARPSRRRPEVVLVTQDDVLAELTVEELAEYTAIEAECAHLGKLLHRGGLLYRIRNAEKTPFMEVKAMNWGQGLRDFPVRVEPVYSAEFEAEYIALYEKWSALEKQVNWYKARFKNRLAELQGAAEELYQKELSQYQAEVGILDTEYAAKLKEYYSLHSEFESVLRNRRTEEVTRISKLKVIIPKTLSAVYKMVDEFDGMLTEGQGS